MPALIIITIILILNLLFNECPLFYRESKSYTLYPEEPEGDPLSRSVRIETGNKRVVLALHGFPSTPATFQYYVPRLAAAGFDVHVPRLPGFGTRPEHLLDQTFSGWYSFAQEYYLELCSRYQEVYLLGLSLGGTLCLKLAEEFAHDHAPRAVAAVSAPVFLNALCRAGSVSRPLLYLSRWLALFLPGWIALPGRHYLEDGAGAWRGYSGLFPRQIHSIKMGVKPVLQELHRIRSPLFVCHSRGDRTVPFANLRVIRHLSGSPWREWMIVDTRPFRHSRHVLFLYDSVRDVILDRILDFYQVSKPL